MNWSKLTVPVVISAAAALSFANYIPIGVLDAVQLRPRLGQSIADVELDDKPPVERTGDTIRIATFNIHTLDATKAENPLVMELRARVVREFDVVAIQGIESREQSLLPDFIELVNATGRSYDFVIGPRLGRTEKKEQYAFLFDRASIEVDRSQLYTIDDPDDVLHHDPFVGWFRVRGPEIDQAFTFSLVNVNADLEETAREMNVLDDVFRAVRDDGRNEDDVILLGDLNADDHHLGQLGKMSGVACIVSGVTTNTRRTQQIDNVIFNWNATREFSGRGGIFDFLREYNLSLDEALEVSDQMPVWGEFSIYEGGIVGRVATRGGND